MKLSEYSRSEDSPDPWPCRQSRRCPNSQAVSRCPSCCTQKLYGGKTHTNTGVNYHPFPAFTSFFQKRELTHCQNLTHCRSCHCYGSSVPAHNFSAATSGQNITSCDSQLCSTPLPYPLVTSGESQSASNIQTPSQSNASLCYSDERCSTSE